jgi:hypothetical protein
MRPTWGQLAMGALVVAGSAASLKVPAILLDGTDGTVPQVSAPAPAGPGPVILLPNLPTVPGGPAARRRRAGSRRSEPPCRRCHSRAAERFGWSARSPRPGGAEALSHPLAGASSDPAPHAEPGSDAVACALSGGCGRADTLPRPDSCPTRAQADTPDPVTPQAHPAADAEPPGAARGAAETAEAGQTGKARQARDAQTASRPPRPSRAPRSPDDTRPGNVPQPAGEPRRKEGQEDRAGQGSTSASGSPRSRRSGSGASGAADPAGSSRARSGRRPGRAVRACGAAAERG